MAIPLSFRAPQDDRRRAAFYAWMAALVILAQLPLVMAIGHRSGPLVVTLAFAAVMVAAVLDGSLAGIVASAGRALASPLGLAAMAFFAWAAVSITWSDVPDTSLAAMAEFGLTVGGVVILALALPRRMSREYGHLVLAGAVAGACVVILIDLWSGLLMRRVLAVQSDPFIFNRPVVTVLTVSLPVILLLLKRQQNWLAAALAALVVVTILQSESGAAMLGLIAGAAAYAVTRLSRRLALALAGIGLVAAVVSAPMIGDIAGRALPPTLHEKLAGSHSVERIEIWKLFGTAVRHEPVIGLGFGASPRFPETHVAERMRAENPDLPPAWHPHNAALQVWVELGAVGAVLGTLVMLLLLRRFAGLPRSLLTHSMAVLAAVVAISLVGHGAWQGWWPAAIGAAIVWLQAAEDIDAPRETG
ncbi:MAG TPA: O-antigen ligase family protein [Beijerinckiaceae bacterium]|nr:O-antigen ligase family protein [Beijerinckiaceae bacterium]